MYHISAFCDLPVGLSHNRRFCTSTWPHPLKSIQLRYFNIFNILKFWVQFGEFVSFQSDFCLSENLNNKHLNYIGLHSAFAT